MSIVVPAVLPTSRKDLEEKLALFAEIPSVQRIQIDVVDGRFAAPASWPCSPPSPRATGGHSATTQGTPYPELEAMVQKGEMLPHLDRIVYEIDLMCLDAERMAEAWLALGATRFTFHAESMTDLPRFLATARARLGADGAPRLVSVGLALNNTSDLSLLEPCLEDIEYVQFMGIARIGRQGQPFDERVVEKVRVFHSRHPEVPLQVDGGVTLGPADKLIALGVSNLVVGSGILRARDPAAALEAFEALQNHPVLRYTKTMTLMDAEVARMEERARAIRETVIRMLVAAGSGHTAGPLGMADIFTALYFHILTHDPKQPEWDGRDRLILSNGHICPVRYAAMAHAGYFPIEECLTLRKFGSRLQGHPERLRLPGVETTSGPLGEGLSQAAGVAYAFRMDKKKNRVYCLMSDGEQQEGNTWEAAMFIGKHKLSNLTAVMDRNNIQIDGMTEDVMPLEPLAEKYRAFNWHVLEVNGNDIPAFIAAVNEAKAIREKPTLIIAHTIPGRGVPEIENDFHWHGKPPTKEEGKRFLKEVRTMGGKIPHEYA